MIRTVEIHRHRSLPESVSVIYRRNSANIAVYDVADDDSLEIDVLRDQRGFYVTIRRYHAKGNDVIGKFEYVPSCKPAPGNLPDRTVNRIINTWLKGERIMSSITTTYTDPAPFLREKALRAAYAVSVARTIRDRREHYGQLFAYTDSLDILLSSPAGADLSPEVAHANAIPRGWNDVLVRFLPAHELSRLFPTVTFTQEQAS
jgi:hypothetical protein